MLEKLDESDPFISSENVLMNLEVIQLDIHLFTFESNPVQNTDQI